MKSKWRHVMPAGFLLLGACSGDGGLPATALDGDATQAAIAMELVSSSLSTSTRLDPYLIRNTDGSFTLGDSGVTITSASVNVDEIKLKLPEGLACASAGFIAGQGVGCEEELGDEDGDGLEMETEVSIHGPFIFDLVTGASTPDIGEITIPSGVYRRTELKLQEAESTSAMQHLTLLATGTFLDADDISHPLELRLKFSVELRIENQNGIQVGEKIANQILVQLNVDGWLDGVPLRQCQQQGDLILAGDGSLILDESTEMGGACQNSNSTILENVKNSFEMQYREQERNGQGDGSNS